VAFTINTNIASLQAQEYLRSTSDFQSKTINRVTSGLRIVSSGDDAAGLAIANGFRSDQAVLTQGVRNANDGLATLQTIDSGISNIGKLLDRARTLAAQSASGTFTGDRSVLNSEFQNVIAEIDRQAQAIGLNEKGIFAKNLSVFVGGGRGADSNDVIINGSVSVDLSNSTVDAKSLALTKVQAANTDYDLYGQVTNIVTLANNVASQANAGETVLRFYGAGFGDAAGVAIHVDLTGVDSAEKLAAAVNHAVSTASVGTDSKTAAFRDAGISAKVIVDENGRQQLGFSANSTFEVRGGDKTANALLGDYKTSGLLEGQDMTYAVASAAATTTNLTAGQAIKLEIRGAGSPSPLVLDYSATAASGRVNAAALATAFNADSAMQAAGLTAAYDSTSFKLTITSARGEAFTLTQSGDTAGALGLGAIATGLTANNGSTDDTTAVLGTFSSDASTGAGNLRLSFSFNGGGPVNISADVAVGNGDTSAVMAAAIQSAIDGTTALAGAGLTASVSGHDIVLTSNNGTRFRVQVSTDADIGGGNALNAALTNYASPTAATGNHEYSGHVIGGAYTLPPLTFSSIDFANQSQTLTLSMNGDKQNIVLNSGNARSLDEAVSTINSAIQHGSAERLKGISAVKTVNASGVEELQFIGPSGPFKLELAGNTTSQGLDDAALILDADADTTAGVSSSIATQTTAQVAVTALADAVRMLGAAQAVVGKGQNQFNFAVSLASTQVTNLAASESRIRDADLAQEAANLTKAQILSQAGVAALAQANSAPQAVLSLLKG